MSGKFIPNGDLDFVVKAESFARALANEPARFEISQEDCDALSAAVVKFRAAFQQCRYGGKSPVATEVKEAAREETARIMRRLGHLVRTNPRLDVVTRMMLGIGRRAEPTKALTVPMESPRLKFVRAHHENNATPMHELSFGARVWGVKKPEGAERLELFVDLIPPDEPIPAYPGANHHSRAWYLRSYKSSPIKLIPPMARVQMRVVYWARWADAQGNVGPFSLAAAGWIEGGSQGQLPGAPQMVFPNMQGQKPVKLIEDTTPHLPGPTERDEKYSVAVLEVRYGTITAEQIAAALPSPVQPEAKQLEGPVEESEAA